MNAFTLVLPLAAVALLTGLAWTVGTAQDVAAALPQTIAAAPAAVAANQPVVQQAPAPDAPECAPPASSAAVATATFADGSRLPALNGVVTDLTMPWPGGGPFSPVLEVIEHQGQQWYRHADGSMSTTVVTRDEVSGKPVTVPMCCRPEPVMKALQRARR
jgi:hypothetical protein